MTGERIRRQKKKRNNNSSNSSDSSRISTQYLTQKIEQFRMMRHRNSTYENYFKIWRSFNKFLVQLDYRPNLGNRKSYCSVPIILKKEHNQQ